jgi:hypothetical protein
MTAPDDLRNDLAVLEAHGAVEPSRELDGRVLRVAHAELRASMEPQWRVMAARAWSNVALPAVIGVVVVGYLHWAFAAASALYQ